MIESAELWSAIGVGATAVISAAGVGGRFAARYFERQQKASERREQNAEAFLQSVLEGNKQSRLDRIKEMEGTRATFVKTVDELTGRFTEAISKLEQECGKQRELDRALIEKLAALEWHAGDPERRHRPHDKRSATER